MAETAAASGADSPAIQYEETIIDPVVLIVGALALAATSAGCTMKSQETPPLAGPSELGAVRHGRRTPDILTSRTAPRSRW